MVMQSPVPFRPRHLGIRALLLACILGAVAPCSAAVPESMLVNAGFETGDFTGWTDVFIGGSGGLGGYGIGSGGTGSLDGYFAYAEDGDGDVTYVEQTAYLAPGQVYTVNAGVASLDPGPANNGDGGNVVVSVNGTQVGAWSCGSINQSQVNATLTASFTATQIANTIRFTISRGFGEDDTPYTCFDNAALVPANAAALASVLHVDPAPGSGVTHAQTSIRIDFSQALNPATVALAAVTLLRSGGDGTFADGNEVVVTPTSVSLLTPFAMLIGIDASAAPDDLYRLTLSGSGGMAIADINGHPIDGEFAGSFPSGDGTPGGDFVCTFGISTAPTLTAFAPGDGAVAVAPGSAIALTFSKAMDLAATQAAFAINPPVAGTFSWLGSTLSFQPSASLPVNTAFTVSIGAGAADTFGSPLAAPFSAGFTTAAAWPGNPLPPGPIANLLHLGATGDDAITGYPASGLSIIWDNFIFAGAGYEYQQQPAAGQAVDMVVAQTQTPLVWTALSAPGGTWNVGTPEGYTMYYAIYVTAPTTRQVCIAYSISGNMRGWMDGAPAPLISDDTGSPSAPFTLTAGTHSFIFKVTNTSGGGQFSIQFTDSGGASMGDLLYQLDDAIQPRVAALVSPAASTAVPLWSDMLIAFSEPMDTTVAASAIGALSPPVAGTWSWTDATHLCFTPTVALAPATTYTVTLAGASAVDLSGNQLAGSATLTFATVAAISTPVIASVTPPSPQRGAQLQLQVNGSGFISGGIIHPPGALPFGGHLYAFYRQPLTWVAGQAACAALGGHLATISSLAEDAFVWQLEGRINGYIGFQDLNEPQEVFTWVNNEPGTYTNWAQGEPNNFLGEIEDKTIYWWGFQWNSVGDGPRVYTGEYEVLSQPTIRLVKAGHSDIAGSAVQLLDGGTLTAQFPTAGAAPGPWDLVVTNPDGGQAVLAGGITLLNTPPVANVGTLQLSSAAPIHGTLTASDANGDPITFAIATPPAHGTLVLNDPVAGSYTYTLTAGYFGSDSFTFTASDGISVSAPATISVSLVASPPQISAPYTTYDGWYRVGPAGPCQLSGGANDAFAVSQVTYTMSGATVGSGTATGTTAWTINAIVNTGTTILTVTATDSAGLTASTQRFLAADATNALVSIDFQDATSAVAAGCVADRGDPYGDRGNGWSYGWSAHNPNGRLRPDALPLEQRYLTFDHMQQYGTYSWSIGVPNGVYVARIVCGDDQVNSPSINNLLVNGAAVFDGGVTPRFDDYLVTVVVTDGRITIAPAPSGMNVKLCYFDLLPLVQATEALTIAPNGSSVGMGPIIFSFCFGAPVSGFTAGAISIGNGSAGAFTAINASTYSLAVTPVVAGPVTVAVGAGAAATIGTGLPTLAASATVTYDPNPPTVAITPNAISTNASPVQFLITFSEPVSGLTAQGVQLINGSTYGLTTPVAIDPAHYRVTVYPGFTPGPVGIQLLPGAAVNDAGTPSPAAFALVTVDTTAPVATITPNQIAVGGSTITFAIVFSEGVSGLTPAGLGATGGSVQTFTAVDSVHYLAVVQPSAPGTVTLSLAAAAAIDAAGNPCPSAQASITYDPTDPLLTITPDGGETHAQPITFSFAFSSAVTGFGLSSITLGNGTPGAFTAIDAEHYTLTVVPTAPGAVTVSVAAGAAIDAANNPNPAVSASMTYRTARPQPSFVALPAASATTIACVVRFDEPVSGFTGSGILVTNGTVTSFTPTSPTTFAILVAPLSPGTVTLAIPAGAASDAAGNVNVAATASCDYDPLPPTVTISPAGGTVSASPIIFTLTYSESPSSLGSMVPTNGSIIFSQRLSPTQYQVSLRPSAAGLVSLSVGAGTITNDAGVANLLGESAVVDYLPAVVDLAISPTGSTTSATSVTFTFTFAAPVTGFSANAVTISNGTAGAFTAIDGAHYQLEVSPAADGPVQVAVAAGAVMDLSGNPNAAASASVTSDAFSPAIAITPNGISTNTAPILFTLTFSEALTDFNAGALTIGNGTLGTVTAIDATHSQVGVAPLAQGPVTLTCPAGAFHDAAANASLASSASVTYDTTDPTLLISAPTASVAAGATVTLTLTFSEPITGLAAGGLTISGCTLGALSGSGAVYALPVTAQSSPGSIDIVVPAGAVSDAAGNPLIAASFTVPIGAASGTASADNTSSGSTTKCGLGSGIASLGLVGALLLRLRLIRRQAA